MTLAAVPAMPVLCEDREDGGEDEDHEEDEDGEEEGDTFETDPNRRGSNESITLRGGSLGTSTVRARRVSVARGTCNLNDPNIQVRTTQCYRLSCIHLITK